MTFSDLECNENFRSFSATTEPFVIMYFFMKYQRASINCGWLLRRGGIQTNAEAAERGFFESLQLVLRLQSRVKGRCNSAINHYCCEPVGYVNTSLSSLTYIIAILHCDNGAIQEQLNNR